MFISEIEGIGKSQCSFTDGIMGLAKVKDMFSEFYIEFIEEKVYDGKTAAGTDKHWDIINIVAKKVSKNKDLNNTKIRTLDWIREVAVKPEY